MDGVSSNKACCLFIGRALNMTLTTDQPLQPYFNGTLWIPTAIIANRVSGAFGVSALGGIYTGAGKTGSIIVAASQSFAGLTGALTSVQMVLALTGVQSANPVYLSLTTGNTGALVADVFVFGYLLD